AAQVRADTHAHEQLGFARAVFVLGVFGGEARAVGVGVGQVRVLALDAGQLVLRPMNDPDRLAAPFDGAHLAGSQVGDVDFDGGAGGAGLFRGGESADKRDGSGHTGDTAHRTGGR